MPFMVRDGPHPFFAPLRWPGWQSEVSAARPDQAIAVYPLLASTEGRSNIAGASRRLVPWTELADLHQELGRQLGGDA